MRAKQASVKNSNAKPDSRIHGFTSNNQTADLSFVCGRGRQLRSAAASLPALKRSIKRTPSTEQERAYSHGSSHVNNQPPQWSGTPLTAHALELAGLLLRLHSHHHQLPRKRHTLHTFRNLVHPLPRDRSICPRSLSGVKHSRLRRHAPALQSERDLSIVGMYIHSRHHRTRTTSAARDAFHPPRRNESSTASRYRELPFLRLTFAAAAETLSSLSTGISKAWGKCQLR